MVLGNDQDEDDGEDAGRHRVDEPAQLLPARTQGFSAQSSVCIPLGHAAECVALGTAQLLTWGRCGASTAARMRPHTSRLGRSSPPQTWQQYCASDRGLQLVPACKGNLRGVLMREGEERTRPAAARRGMAGAVPGGLRGPRMTEVHAGCRAHKAPPPGWSMSLCHRLAGQCCPMAAADSNWVGGQLAQEHPVPRSRYLASRPTLKPVLPHVLQLGRLLPCCPCS